MTMKLVVNADDFGYTRAVNYGIIDAYSNGIVTSATLMTNMPHVDHAVELSKQNPGLGIGVHLVLTAGSPISKNVPSLVGSAGQFHKRSDLLTYAKIEEVEHEWRTQIETFLSSGLNPTHLDSHHNVHSNDFILRIAIKLAKEYKLPLRRANNEQENTQTYKGVRTTDFLFRDFYGEENINAKTIEMFLDRFSNTNLTVEMYCHPGYIDSNLLDSSSYVHPRVEEVSILTSEKIKMEMAKKGVESITYDNV